MSKSKLEADSLENKTNLTWKMQKNNNNKKWDDLLRPKILRWRSDVHEIVYMYIASLH